MGAGGAPSTYTTGDFPGSEFFGSGFQGDHSERWMSTMTTENQPAPPFEDALHVTLSRGDFVYFNWALAMERLMLPFFLYGFVLFTLASLLGVLPAGRTVAVAFVVPATGYCLWLTFAVSALWRKLPQLAAPRVYRFRDEAYQVEVETEERISYRDLAQVLESRRGFYLRRADGTHDILPKRALLDTDAFSKFLHSRAGDFKRSKFL
jgi:hypothetical protein